MKWKIVLIIGVVIVLVVGGIYALTNKNKLGFEDVGVVTQQSITEQTEFQEGVTYTKSTDTVCSNGTCTKSLYSGVRNVYEDDTWKRVENANSLKDKEGIYFVFLEDDPAFKIIINDFNISSVNMTLDFLGNPADYPTFCQVTDSLNAKCDFKIDEKWEEINDSTGEIIPKSQLKFQYKWEIKDGVIIKGDNIKYEYKGNPFARAISFGGNSTTIQLQDADTENLDDSQTNNDFGFEDNNYGSCDFFRVLDENQDDLTSYVKFNLSSIPGGVTIDDSLVSLYMSGNGIDAGESMDIEVHHVDPFPDYQISGSEWIEGDECNSGAVGSEITWNNQPSGGEFNATEEDTLSFDSTNATDVRYNFNVTQMVGKSYDDGDLNITIMFLGTNEGALETSDYLTFRSKERDPASVRPYLNITYTVGVADTCTYSSGNWVIDCSDACNISSQVDVLGNNITINGTGTFNTTANIINYTKLTTTGTDSTNRCIVRCNGGCFID